MANRSGGKTTKDRVPSNYFFIDPVAARMCKELICHFPKKQNRILDACCGDGVLGYQLSRLINFHNRDNKPQSVEFVDIEKMNNYHTFTKMDILDYNYGVYDVIICNPPWVPVDLAENIYNHLLSLLSKDGVLIFIINNTFKYQGWERATKLKWHYWYDLPRYIFDYGANKEIKVKKQMAKGKTREQADSTVLLDCGIMVYHNGWNPIIRKDNWFLHVPREVCVDKEYDDAKCKK